MERSGSTVAWQIVSLLTASPPEKTHEYVKGSSPVLYTYRHPKEAYLSLLRCFEQIYPFSIAKDYAYERLCMQISVFEKFKKDKEEKNRNVLFLKYEDYYFHESTRVITIADWLEVALDDKKRDEIVNQTSVANNKDLSQTAGNFGEFNKVTGLHGSHINPVTNGCPGMLMKSASYREDSFLNSEKMSNMCTVFGYETDSLVVK